MNKTRNEWSIKFSMFGISYFFMGADMGKYRLVVNTIGLNGMTRKTRSTLHDKSVALLKREEFGVN